MSFHVPSLYRLGPGEHPTYASTPEDGNNGMFVIPKGKLIYVCIASDGLGWEHVSITLRRHHNKSPKFGRPPSRTPTWEEMCFVKGLFWGPEDAVLQYHPPEKVYVSCHDYCLHLWRSTRVLIPVPDALLVGPKENP